MSYRYAVEADIRRFYGYTRTMRAVAILKGDEPLAIIGLADTGDVRRLFSDYKPELNLKSMTILRAIKLAMQMVCASRKPVVAVEQPGTNMLQRLGFVHVEDDVYRWER